MKLTDKIILTEKMIKLIKQEFGTEKCPDFSFGCCNCQAFIVLGWLDSYRWDLKHELKQNLRGNGSGALTKRKEVKNGQTNNTGKTSI